MTFEDVTLNDGYKMPAIAYGTGSKWKGKSVVEYVQTAIDVGFSHLDTAQFYQTEEDVGQAIRESGLARDEFFVTTKYSGGVPVQVAFKASLQKLGLKHVDLYLIHNPRIIGTSVTLPLSPTLLTPPSSSRSIGVSNFEVEHFKTIFSVARIIPAVNQIHLHPYNYAESKPVLDFCAQHKIVVEAYSSLDPITKYPGGPVDAPLAAAAAKRNATPVQALFLWVRAKGVVIVTTSSTRSHMEEYLAISELEPLTAEEVAAIDEAGGKGPPALTWSKRVRAQFTMRNAIAAVVLVLMFLQLFFRMSFLQGTLT
uniref:NADP-dependent oxidoreductase domain-containing protein n=1 Tax=Schizophyllum commune (strain H4-8 / FGSC 9210) TaxID=578458 RepID=D8PVB6_SCHCM